MTTPLSSEHHHNGVVVGFDGSPHAIDALFWAAQAAALRNTRLTVASAFIFPYSDYIRSMSGSTIDDPARRLAEEKLAEARSLLEEQHHIGEVDYRALIGDATDWLVRLSEQAELVVVGRRGLGKFWGRVLGSVASALPAHARCPTVVVHSLDSNHDDAEQQIATTPDARPVCVGVDGSHHARHAAVVAAREAKRLGVSLELVQAQPHFTGTSTVWYLAANEKMEQQIHEDIAQSLQTEMQHLQHQVPGVEISPVVQRQVPAEAMIDCTKRAQLTVLGTRGHGGFASLLLGSVSRTTLAHAQGTVMIVPAVNT
ncbi:MAG TPA: universal stress protein [Enteractinococcus sp.]